MTSGNVSDEPIAYRNDEALERLGAMADLFLLHDRPIHMRTDDSIVRAIDRRPPLLLRRSRGYVPDSLPVPLGTGGAVLACGAELKSTFCLAKGGRAWVSHHIGDLQNAETSRSFREGIAHYERPWRSRPQWSRTTFTPTICQVHTPSSARMSGSLASNTITRIWRRAWPNTGRPAPPSA